MAEFLIKKISAINPDPIKNESGCYKRGDVVQVYKDGECKEPPSPNSNMLIVKVPGMTKEEALKYTESEIRDDGLIEEGQPILTTVRRRKYKFDFSLLTLKVNSDLAIKREATITTVEQAMVALKMK